MVGGEVGGGVVILADGGLVGEWSSERVLTMRI